MRVIAQKSIYNYLKSHPGFKKEVIDIVERIEHAKWQNHDDILKDFKHLDFVKVNVRNGKEVIVTVPDDKIRLLFKVAFNMGVVFIK